MDCKAPNGLCSLKNKQAKKNKQTNKQNNNNNTQKYSYNSIPIESDLGVTGVPCSISGQLECN